MHILVIEDDPLTSRSIGLLLQAAGLECTTAATGESGIELARSRSYDAILLDLTLPDLDGEDVLRRLRTARITTPVMILTGNGALQSKVATFELGADDYVTKPFQRDELLARIQALVRRSAGQASSVVTTGALAVDLIERRIEVNGTPVHVTRKEYAIVELLTLRKGLTLTKGMFIAHLYGGRDEPEHKIIDVFMCKLRKKLAQAGAGASGCIETVWGRGYALRDPEVAPPMQAEAA